MSWLHDYEPPGVSVLVRYFGVGSLDVVSSRCHSLPTRKINSSGLDAREETERCRKSGVKAMLGYDIRRERPVVTWWDLRCIPGRQFVQECRVVVNSDFLRRFFNEDIRSLSQSCDRYSYERSLYQSVARGNGLSIGLRPSRTRVRFAPSLIERELAYAGSQYFCKSSASSCNFLCRELLFVLDLV